MLLQSLNERAGRDNLLRLTSDNIDVLLVFLHSGDIIIQRAHLLSTSRGVESEHTSQLLSISAVLVDAKLYILTKLLVELLVVVFVLSNLLHSLHNLLDNVLTDDLEDLVLLEHFSGDVEWKILRVDNTLDKVQILRDDLLTVVHDEHTSDIQLNVVLLLVFKQIKGSSLRNEQQGSELKLTLNREVLDSQMILPVIGQALVELSVLLV